MPNIVVILADDQRVDTIKWMPTVREELKREGTAFTNAMVPTSVCCPSRASLLTGLFAHDTGVWSNVGQNGGWPTFHANGMEDRTIATWLGATHHTMLVGKYLNQFDLADAGYVPPGWDVWHAFAGVNGRYYDYALAHTDGSITEHGDAADDYSTDVLRRLAVREIDAAPTDEPLLLLFTPYAPHGPTTPAPRHLELARDSVAPYLDAGVNEARVGDKPPWIRKLALIDERRIDELRRLTRATLRSLDRAVDAILGALARTGRLSNTLVIYTSDHGASWGEHRVPLNNKSLPYTAQTRVPLIVRWDGRVPAGGLDERVALNVDVPVTAARAARIDPGPIAGLSFLGTEERRGFVLEAPTAVFTEGISFDRPAYCGYRTRRYAFVHYAAGNEELYDYRLDRDELRNRARAVRYERLVSRLRKRAMAACVPTPPGFAW